MTRNRICIMGLDGATWRILMPLVEEGKLPNLQRLMEGGTSGILDSIVPPVTAPAWTSFQTGMNPGKHGIDDFILFDPNTRTTSFANSSAVRAKTIWEVVSEHGMRFISINVPVTYPPKKLNGITVGGMLSPSEKSRFIQPEDVGEELLRVIDDYKIMSTHFELRWKGVKKFVDDLIYIEQRRVDAALYLMDRYEWDLCMVHNISTDVLQHALWNYMDRDDPKSDPETRDSLYRFYQSMDDNIGRILASVPQPADIVVLSDHGFGEVRRQINLNVWLKHQGFFAQTRSLDWSSQRNAVISLMKRLDYLNIRKALIPKTLRDSVDPQNTLNQLIDWEKTLAYAVNGSIYGHIYINVNDRDSTEGRKALEDIRGRVSEDLRRLMDPQTGEPVVHQVYTKEEIFFGPCADRLPDLVVAPREGYVFSPEISGKRQDLFEDLGEGGDVGTGTHQMDGIVILQGEHIGSDGHIRAKLIDIFPTVLYLMGIPIPDEVDGRVLTEVVKPSHLEKKPIRYVTEQSEFIAGNAEHGYSESDELLIRQRLKDLGYID